MGRTNQVLTGGTIFSTSPQTTTMKIVLALLVLCLFQFSLAEQEDIDTAETNLVLERDVRDAGRKRCTGSGKNCRKRGKKSRKERKRKKGGKKRKQTRKSNARKSSGQKKGGKKSGKIPNLKNENKKKLKAGRRQKGEARSSSRSARGRNTTGDTCFADLVAKTKKFNKAQVEYGLCKRVQTWGKLMKNKKNNSASTFADALEA